MLLGVDCQLGERYSGAGGQRDDRLTAGRAGERFLW